METQEVRRTVSKIKTLGSNKPEPERNFYFYCWFDPAVRIREEFQEGRKHCNTYEVDCDHQPDQDAATIVGRGAFADQNKKDVECVRSYFVDHGWKEEEE
jgi:hypothetical protein